MVCNDVTVQLDGNGNATVAPGDIDNGQSSDNCSVSLSVSPNTFDCSNVGTPVTVTLTGTDPSGNSASCTADVTVEDNLGPNAVCQDITAYLNGSGLAFVNASDIDGGSSDNCGVATITTNAFIYGCGDVGNNTATLTVTDVNGNVSTCTANIEVADTIPPVAICQDVTVQLDANGQAGVIATQLVTTVSDNCGSVTCACDSVTPNNFDCTNLGVNMVTVIATDVNGNSSTCDADVTVEDNMAPNAVCQDITVSLDANGDATISAAMVDGGSSDNCSLTLAIDNNSFDCSNTGSNTVTLTATDPSGNSDNCTANVTVEDNMAPTASCQDLTVQLGANGSVTVPASDIDNGSSDNCGVSLSTMNNTFDCDDFRGGDRAITLTVTDPSGNVSTCSANITTVDTTFSICCPIALDFEEDAMGNSLAPGTLVASQWVNDFVNISAVNNNGPNQAILFGSDNPTGNDDDLGTPNQLYNGPGIGNGGASNDQAEGNILIIAENLTDNNNDGLVDNPNDEASGGRIFFDFTRYSTVDTIVIIDSDENQNRIRVTQQGGVVTNISVPNGGDNSRVAVPINMSNVSQIRIKFKKSGGVASMTYCPDGAPITNKDNIGVAAASGDLENSFEAFPNPFIDETNLRFSLGMDADVTLKVYDLRGVEVASLYEGFVSEGEIKVIDFKPENLAKGIYYARLTTADGTTMVQKLVFK